MDNSLRELHNSSRYTKVVFNLTTLPPRRQFSQTWTCFLETLSGYKHFFLQINRAIFFCVFFHFFRSMFVIQLFCPRITVDTILLCLTQVWTSKLPAPSKALHNWSNYSLEKRLQVIYHRLGGFLPTLSKIFLVLKNSNFYLLSYLNNAENSIIYRFSQG